jgi:predicted Zn-ribbon and HTH transcriptional regulator
MHTHGAAYERLRGVLSEADEPLTAREILAALEERDEARDLSSTHRVATILGRQAEHGEVEVVQGSPYRYRLNT